jgi:hypothetical protein
MSGPLSPERIARGVFVTHDPLEPFTSWKWQGVVCNPGSSLVVTICTLRPAGGRDFRVDATVGGVTSSQFQFDEASETVHSFVFPNVTSSVNDIAFTVDAPHNYFSGFVTEIRRAGDIVETLSPTSLPDLVSASTHTATLSGGESMVFMAIHTEGQSSDNHGCWINMHNGQTAAHPDGGASYLSEGWCVSSETGPLLVGKNDFTPRVASYSLINFARTM